MALTTKRDDKPMPPWAPGFDERHRQIFLAWLNEKLEESYDLDVTADDIAREVWINEHPDEYEAGLRESHRRQREKAIVDRALRNNTYQHPRGRAPGDPRPRDLSVMERVIRSDALEIYERIRDIVQAHYNGRFKGATDIAAERSGCTKEELRKLQRHQPKRHSARKSPT